MKAKLVNEAIKHMPGKNISERNATYKELEYLKTLIDKKNIYTNFEFKKIKDGKIIYKYNCGIPRFDKILAAIQVKVYDDTWYLAKFGTTYEDYGFYGDDEIEDNSDFNEIVLEFIEFINDIHDSTLNG